MPPDDTDDADASPTGDGEATPDSSGESENLSQTSEESENPGSDSSESENPDSAFAGDAVDDDQQPCPECGETLPAAARFCPYCSAAIDEDGSAVDLSDLDGDVLEDPTELIEEDEMGLRRASGRVRVLAGLAVSIPLAPLVLFLVGSVTSLSVWAATLVFLAGWFGPAAVLSRSRVPAEAFGRSLYLIAVGTLLIPVVIETSGDAWGGSVSFDTVALVSLVLAGVLIALGTFVTGQARKRVTGDRRGFESHREE